MTGRGCGRPPEDSQRAEKGYPGAEQIRELTIGD